MAFYNGFPATYPQYNYLYQQTQTSPNSNQDINLLNNQTSTQYNQQVVAWVIGESAAKSYYLPANTTGYLFDTENDVFYVKVTDRHGNPTQFHVYDYTERIGQNNNRLRNMNNELCVTKEEFDALRNDFESFRREFMPATEQTEDKDG